MFTNAMVKRTEGNTALSSRENINKTMIISDLEISTCISPPAFIYLSTPIYIYPFIFVYLYIPTYTDIN